HGNVDIRENVGRGTNNGQGSQNEDQDSHHYKSVGTAESELNDPHDVPPTILAQATKGLPLPAPPPRIVSALHSFVPPNPELSLTWVDSSPGPQRSFPQTLDG